MRSEDMPAVHDDHARYIAVARSDEARQARDLFRRGSRTPRRRVPPRVAAVRNRGRLIGGPNPARSVLSVARAFDRRPVCRVWPAAPAVQRGGLTLNPSISYRPSLSPPLSWAQLRLNPRARRYATLCFLGSPSLASKLHSARPVPPNKALRWLGSGAACSGVPQDIGGDRSIRRRSNECI
jgi:hypothetical protein